LLALSLLLFLGTYARLSKALPPVGVLLYGTHLSSVAGLMLFAFAGLLQVIEAHAARGRLVSTLLALGLISPFIHYVAAHVASGDGLRARGVPELLSTSVGFTALALVAVIVWSYRFWAGRRVLDVLFALVAIAGLLLAESQMSRAQTQLATLLQLFAIFLATELVLISIGRDERRQLRLGLVLTGVCLSAALVGLCFPKLVESGRRRALVAESSAAYVDARLFGTSRSNVPPKIDDKRCRALSKERPVPALSLGAEQRRNVILISIDTLRADYVLSRVNGELLMPGLVEFSEEARYAARAQTAFPATLLAMTSAFTGYMPSDILLAPRPLKNLFTLTRGHLDAVEGVLPRGSYFTRPDVQAYLLSGAQTEAVGSARQETAYAIARLRELRAEEKRHLMWIHYFEPHEPYELRESYGFGDSETDRYRSELAFVDEQLSRLLRFLREEGWYDDSLIMVFADHGESFGEHDHFHHHYLVYPWLVNVPLMWRAPDTEPGRVDAPVHLMDVTPSVLHFLGLPAPAGIRGSSLLAGSPPKTRLLFSEEISISGRMMLQYRNQPAKSEAELFARLVRLENGPGYSSKLGVRSGDRYLIQQRSSLANELYAWRSDPLAAHDLADIETGTAAALNQEAERWRMSVFERAACDLSPAHSE
jgi:arylsulfatase A-like enzyme